MRLGIIIIEESFPIIPFRSKFSWPGRKHELSIRTDAEIYQGTEFYLDVRGRW